MLAVSEVDENVDDLSIQQLWRFDCVEKMFFGVLGLHIHRGANISIRQRTNAP